MGTATVDEMKVQNRLLAPSLRSYHCLDLFTDVGWFLFQLGDAHKLDSGEALSGVDSDPVDIGVVVLELSHDGRLHRFPDLVGYALQRHSVRYPGDFRDPLFSVFFKLQSVTGVKARGVYGKRGISLDQDIAFLFKERQIVSCSVNFLGEPKFCDVGFDLAVEIWQPFLEPFSVVPGELVAVDCACQLRTDLFEFGSPVGVCVITVFLEVVHQADEFREFRPIGIHREVTCCYSTSLSSEQVADDLGQRPPMLRLGGDEVFPVAAEFVCIGMEIEETEVEVSALHTDNVLALWSRIGVREGIDSQNAVVEAGEVSSEGSSVQVIDSELDPLHHHLYSLYFQLVDGSRFTGFNVGTGRGSSTPAKEFESEEDLKEVV